MLETIPAADTSARWAPSWCGCAVASMPHKTGRPASPKVTNVREFHPYNLQTPPHHHRGKAEERRCRANTKALPPARALADFHTARGKSISHSFNNSVHRPSNFTGQ
ncbi:hypothetical protein TcG_10113 [Trypanosoma cruzi]|nr:hypothetical protein TcG_10113 [Trypanosoma cruzi]